MDRGEEKKEGEEEMEGFRQRHACMLLTTSKHILTSQRGSNRPNYVISCPSFLTRLLSSFTTHTHTQTVSVCVCTPTVITYMTSVCQSHHPEDLMTCLVGKSIAVFRVISILIHAHVHPCSVTHYKNRCIK